MAAKALPYDNWHHVLAPSSIRFHPRSTEQTLRQPCYYATTVLLVFTVPPEIPGQAGNPGVRKSPGALADRGDPSLTRCPSPVRGRRHELAHRGRQRFVRQVYLSLLLLLLAAAATAAAARPRRASAQPSVLLDRPQQQVERGWPLPHGLFISVVDTHRTHTDGSVGGWTRTYGLRQGIDGFAGHTQGRRIPPHLSQVRQMPPGGRGLVLREKKRKRPRTTRHYRTLNSGCCTQVSLAPHQCRMQQQQQRRRRRR